MGMGIGAAMTGLRPIVEGMNMGFLLLAYNQISNNAGMLHYTSGGQFTVRRLLESSIQPPGDLGRRLRNLPSPEAHVSNPVPRASLSNGSHTLSVWPSIHPSVCPSLGLHGSKGVPRSWVAIFWGEGDPMSSLSILYGAKPTCPRCPW
jgi:Transketolase, pyrimidine binding domain